MKQVLLKNETFKWIDVYNPTQDDLKSLQSEFLLHPILLQDCLDPIHLPKFERSGTTQFLIIRVADLTAGERVDTIQSLTRKIAIFIGPDFLITIHRLDQEQFGKLSQNCLLEAADRYGGNFNDNNKLQLVLIQFLNRAIRTFHQPLEKAEDRLDQFESALFARKAQPKMLKNLHLIRRRLSLIKRILIHTQDAVQRLSPPGEALHPLFQDLRENLSTIVFLNDELSDDANSLLNLQISLASQKTNEVMRVLTIFSVFFMPLNFLAGIYGMNFKHMPELDHPMGYPVVILSMMLITLLIGGWFYKKGWLRSHQDEGTQDK